MIKIVVNPKRSLGVLEREVFGGFIEHLGRCIYGGLYEEGSAHSDERGFRTDVLDLLRELRVSILRWPGGNFVSNYHWQHGVGPKPDRRARPDLAWGGIESNRFGTDEYLAYCQTLGAEPYICLNMGSGTLEEALDWIEYCNGDADTYWANQRRANGHIKPYGVTWWALGNEMYGKWQVGTMRAADYVIEATRWARAIKLLDPSVRLVSCGESGWTDWDATVATGMAPIVDLHSIHLYTGSPDYWTNILGPMAAERAIEVTSAILHRAAYNQKLTHQPRIAYDEWNIWWREIHGGLEERFVFHDALAVGTFLNVFVRNAAWVKMANLAQMVNAIAPVVTTPDAAAVQPIYYPAMLHAHGHLRDTVDVWVDGPTVEAPEEWISRWPHRVHDLAPFSLLDVAATVDEHRSRVALTVVNRSEHDERVELSPYGARLSGPVSLRTVTASSRPSPIEGIETAEITEGTADPASGIIALTLPASSFTLIEAALD